MKKNSFLPFVLILSSFFISCATTVETVKSGSPVMLKEDEGFVLMRILNPTAGRTVDEFHYSNGKAVRNMAPLHLNSDLQIKRLPGSFYVSTVANTEAPEQIVLLKAKKGSYGIIKTGENSEYFNPYAFKVEAGAVNYAGDIKLDIVTGRISVWREIKDYYDLSVSDSFDEILNLRDSSDLFSAYSDLEFINQAKNTETMRPLFCHVIRDN